MMPKLISAGVHVDVVVDIRYSFRDDVSTCIYTNARTDNGSLEEILSNWVQDQIGVGRIVGSSPRDRDIYRIRIGLVLVDDHFCTESDTGTLGLTVGIVLDVLAHLPTISIQPLSARADT